MRIYGKQFVSGLLALSALLFFQNCGQGISNGEALSGSNSQASGQPSQDLVNPAATPTPAVSPSPTPVAQIRNIWTSVNGAGAPSQRVRPAVVWAGNRIFVFGGANASNGQVLSDLHSYDPSTNTWTAINPVNALAVAIVTPRGFWTGSKLVLFGSDASTNGAMYDVATNSWQVISNQNTHPTFAGSAVVWMGTQFLMFGGGASTPNNVNYVAYNNAVSTFDPVANSWRRLANVAGVPSARTSAILAWTGNRVLVFRGFELSGNVMVNRVSDLFSFDPGTNVWQTLSSVGVPEGERELAYVWTGSKLFVWGGSKNEGVTYERVNTGALYDPATNTWSATSMTNAPFRRTWHKAVMLRGKVFVFGGGATSQSPAEDPLGRNISPSNTGGIYDPVANTWVTSSVVNAPGAHLNAEVTSSGSQVFTYGHTAGAQAPLNSFGVFD